MTSVHPFAEALAASSPRLSRRECLGLAVAVPLLQACGGGSSDAAAEPESVRWCRDAIRTTLARSGNQTTALSVALLADERVVWREAFGYADRENGVRATPDTRFNLASVGKLFATLSVMILRDRGMLSLDQPLVQLLPSFRMRSPGFTRITVRHMLSHASGVPGVNARNDFNFAPILDYAQDTLEALATSHLKHEPGELSVYCNDGFTLVEPLVRQLTGLSFTDFVQREIFDPLGMNLSAYPLAPAAEGSFVHSYHEGVRMPQEMAAPLATGGILSTPTELMKLARLFMDEGMYEGRRIVSAEAIREMGTDQSVRARINPTSLLWHWGLGWDTMQQPAMQAAGLRGWAKNGGSFFVATEFFVLPEARLAMLVTGSGFDFGGVALGEGLLLRAAAERGVIRSLPAAIVPTVPALVSPAPDTAELVGLYANYNAPIQVQAADDGALMLRVWNVGEGRWGDAPIGPLRARSDGHWSADGEGHPRYRFPTVLGRRYLVAVGLSGHRLYATDEAVGEQLPAMAEPLPQAWRLRVGSEWTCDNDAPDSISRRLGPLVWRIDELPEAPGHVFLRTVQPAGFVLQECAQFLRVVDDDTAGMTVKVPGNKGRDLFELSVGREAGTGHEMLYSGSLVFRRRTA